MIVTSEKVTVNNLESTKIYNKVDQYVEPG